MLFSYQVVRLLYFLVSINKRKKYTRIPTHFIKQYLNVSRVYVVTNVLPHIKNFIRLLRRRRSSTNLYLFVLRIILPEIKFLNPFLSRRKFSILLWSHRVHLQPATLNTAILYDREHINLYITKIPDRMLPLCDQRRRRRF